MYVVIELVNNYQNEVTTVICRKIKPSHEKDYNDWVRRYLTFERKAPGYLGITVIVPGGSSKSPLRYIIRRFADKAAMKAWDNSEESLTLIEEADNYLHDITRHPLVWKHRLLCQVWKVLLNHHHLNGKWPL
jgi:antibiotic biosynthesis monooxygenase (ABM) superfamily enzyme